jgi:ADP-L-glycero-D-manno-heptose 6-epimerase
LIGIHKVNVFGTAALFEGLYKQGCRKFIYASSTAIYGHSPAPYVEDKTPIAPLTPYAYSKMAVEHYAHAFHRLHPDARCLGLRYCNVYGPGEHHKGTRVSMIYQILKTMKAGEKPRLFKYGQQRRDWVHVEDVVQANLLALEATDFQDEVANVGSGGTITFELLVQWINSLLGTHIVPDYIENPYESTYQWWTQCDITWVRQILGYDPKFTGITGIKHYLENWS